MTFGHRPEAVNIIKLLFAVKLGEGRRSFSGHKLEPT